MSSSSSSSAKAGSKKAKAKAAKSGKQQKQQQDKADTTSTSGSYALAAGGHVLLKNVCHWRAKQGARGEQMTVGHVYEVPIGGHSNPTQDELDLIRSEAFDSIQPCTFE